ncbi:hypothetical protein A9Z42_0035530 [Trichoderma parareesei]|uniref:Uncharacterized protein n=1 Tax=Trichoderma parareesei TaxID=858221 RepID=A0A2H2ZSV0_TRIPA|nr:hypothetical protein A9Z42_0035530 [Trichoderma parareesei]
MLAWRWAAIHLTPRESSHRTSKGEASQAPFLAELPALGCAKDEAVPNRQSSFTVAIALSHGAELMGGCRRAVGAEDPQGSQDSVDASEVSMHPWFLQVYPQREVVASFQTAAMPVLRQAVIVCLAQTPVVRLR